MDSSVHSDGVRSAFPQRITALPTLQDVLKDGLGKAVVARDKLELELEELDLASCSVVVVGLVLQVGDVVRRSFLGHLFSKA